MLRWTEICPVPLKIAKTDETAHAAEDPLPEPSRRWVWLRRCQGYDPLPTRLKTSGHAALTAAIKLVRGPPTVRHRRQGTSTTGRGHAGAPQRTGPRSSAITADLRDLPSRKTTASWIYLRGPVPLSQRPAQGGQHGLSRLLKTPEDAALSSSKPIPTPDDRQQARRGPRKTLQSLSTSPRRESLSSLLELARRNKG